MHIDNVIFLILSKNAYTKFSEGPPRGEQLTQDFASPTAPMPFDMRDKPFYNRPSDCCFRLACSVALLMPITIRTIAPESVSRLAVCGNSTIQQSIPPYGFVNRVPTFDMDTENFHFPHFKGICMILLPFHTNTPCEPHYSGYGKG